MAERRMFAKTIIDSDPFLDMPLSTQCLYFHLCMRADDDGFLNNPRKVMRMIGASDIDAQILLQKRFILAFETGVIVIKHWRIHNWVRGDRKQNTIYQEELARLEVKKDGGYTDHRHTNDNQVTAVCQPCDNQMPTVCQPNVNQLTTTCQPSDNQVTTKCHTEDRIGKDSIGKYSIEEEKPKTAKRFSPPSIEDVKAYCSERGYSINAEEFYAHYESNGWMVGRNKMKSWQSAVVKWKCNEEKWNTGKVGRQTTKAYEMVHNHISEEQIRDTTDLERLERDLL